VAIVKTFNGHKKIEIIGIAQGGNMLKNSKHFVYIIHEDQRIAVNQVRQEIIKLDALECDQSNKTKVGIIPEKLLIKSKHNRPWSTRLKAFENSVYTPSTWVAIFNFVNAKIRKVYQNGDSKTALHETLLHC
jgi:hypothetical protein